LIDHEPEREPEQTRADARPPAKAYRSIWSRCGDRGRRAARWTRDSRALSRLAGPGNGRICAWEWSDRRAHSITSITAASRPLKPWWNGSAPKGSRATNHFTRCESFTASALADLHGLHAASSGLRHADIRTTSAFYADRRVKVTPGFGSAISGASVTHFSLEEGTVRWPSRHQRREPQTLAGPALPLSRRWNHTARKVWIILRDLPIFWDPDQSGPGHQKGQSHHFPVRDHASSHQRIKGPRRNRNYFSNPFFAN